jgi:CopG family transcriptional regulator, nickel-responsive regulator
LLRIERLFIFKLIPGKVVTVVSLSFPDSMIQEMDALQKSLGFTGRSELVRASIRLLLQDVKDSNAAVGGTSAVVVVTHTEENEETVTRIKHQFDDIVKTHIHNKIAKNNCVELFLLDGDAAEVNAMTKEFQKQDTIKSVKLVKV